MDVEFINDKRELYSRGVYHSIKDKTTALHAYMRVVSDIIQSDLQILLPINRAKIMVPWILTTPKI